MGAFEYLKFRFLNWIFQYPLDYAQSINNDLYNEVRVLERRLGSVQTTLNMISSNHSEELNKLTLQILELQKPKKVKKSK